MEKPSETFVSSGWWIFFNSNTAKELNSDPRMKTIWRFIFTRVHRYKANQVEIGVATKYVRRPGIEPGSQEWESCMIPLHQRRSLTRLGNVYLKSVAQQSVPNTKLHFIFTQETLTSLSCGHTFRAVEDVDERVGLHWGINIKPTSILRFISQTALRLAAPSAFMIKQKPYNGTE